MSTYYERNKDKIREQRRKRYEQKKQEQEQNVFSMNNSEILQHDEHVNEHTRPLGSWSDICEDLLLPRSALFLGTIVLFSVFLIWQGAMFFMKQGYSTKEAYVCSVFGELLLIVSSALIFRAETKRTKKVFTVICSLSIILLGAFLHNGVKKSLVEANPEYQRTKSEYELTQAEIKTLKQDKSEQPENYKTKRNEIQNKIETKLNVLGSYSEKLSAFESKSMGLGEYYVAWIRVALMILNAYLVHAFLRELSLNLGDY